jgi:hypothetical protein
MRVQQSRLVPVQQNAFAGDLEHLPVGYLGLTANRDPFAGKNGFPLAREFGRTSIITRRQRFFEGSQNEESSSFLKKRTKKLLLIAGSKKLALLKLALAA